MNKFTIPDEDIRAAFMDPFKVEEVNLSLRNNPRQLELIIPRKEDELNWDENDIVPELHELDKPARKWYQF